MHSSKYKLGDILKEHRAKRRMSLREFSEYLSISHAYLNKLEKGIDPRNGKPIMPTIETLTKISEGLEIPMEDFLNKCGYFDNDITELSDLVNQFIKNVFSNENLFYNGIPLSENKSERLEAVKALVADMIVDTNSN